MNIYPAKEIEKEAYSLIREHFYNACWNAVHPDLARDAIAAVPHLVLFPEDFQDEWCDVRLVDSSDIISRTVLAGGRSVCVVRYFIVNQTADDLCLEWKDSDWLIPWLTDWYGHYRTVPSLSDQSSTAAVHLEDVLEDLDMRDKCRRAALVYAASHGSAMHHCHL